MVAEPRLHAPAPEVLRDGDDELVLAGRERQVQRVPVPDAAEEAVVARAVGVVAAVERPAVQIDHGAIAEELYIGETTVKTHITHILQKLDLRDRVQAVVLAYEAGLFDAQPAAE